MFCPYCGNKIHEGVNVCPKCRSSLKSLHEPSEYECDKCGSSVPIDSQFCPKCGDKFEEEMSTYSSTDRNHPAFVQEEMNDDHYDFIADKKSAEYNPKLIQTYTSKENVKNALESHDIFSTYKYRRYNLKFVRQDSDKGEWLPIPDLLFKELGLSKDDLLKSENEIKRIALITLGVIGVVLIGLIFVGVKYLVPHTHIPKTGGEWGLLIFGILGYITAVIYVWIKWGLVFGIITAIAVLVALKRLLLP